MVSASRVRERYRVLASTTENVVTACADSPLQLWERALFRVSQLEQLHMRRVANCQLWICRQPPTSALQGRPTMGEEMRGRFRDFELAAGEH